MGEFSPPPDARGFRLGSTRAGASSVPGCVVEPSRWHLGMSWLLVLIFGSSPSVFVKSIGCSRFLPIGMRPPCLNKRASCSLECTATSPSAPGGPDSNAVSYVLPCGALAAGYVWRPTQAASVPHGHQVYRGGAGHVHTGRRPGSLAR